jgi:hypothetical protein
MRSQPVRRCRVAVAVVDVGGAIREATGPTGPIVHGCASGPSHLGSWVVHGGQRVHWSSGPGPGGSWSSGPGPGGSS